ncbi:MAG: hypothetical protein Q8R34_00865 [bacterium]|nr:hypothetical protein [bacterium]
MTSQSRKVLFIWAVALFVSVSTLVLIFAFGFRYDFKNNVLTKTGSLVLKPNTEAQIFIDDESEGRTSFLNNTFSKKQLLPGKYMVKVQKDKHFSWQKEVEVKEGLVSDFSRIVLFSQNQVEQVSVNGKSPLFIDREGQKAIYWEKDSVSFYEVGGSQPIYKSEPIVLDSATLKVLWGAEGKEAVVYDKSKVFYFDLSKKTFKAMGFSRQYSLENAVLKNGGIYFLKDKDLFVLSTGNLKSKIISKNLISFSIHKNEIFALATNSDGPKLIKMGLNAEGEQVLGGFPAGNSKPAGIIKKVEYRDGDYYLLIDSGLYLLKDSQITLTNSNIAGFAISPDNTALGWHNDHEFWVEWIKDAESQPLKKAGEKELVGKVPKNIQGFSWYKNGGYVFLELEDGLTVLETDLRGGANMYTILVPNSQEQAWYDLNQDKIFKLSALSGLAAIDVP